VNVNEELLERKSSVSGLEIEVNGREGSAVLTMQHPLYLQKLPLKFAGQ
jgi:hypothetical protein